MIGTRYLVAVTSLVAVVSLAQAVPVAAQGFGGGGGTERQMARQQQLIDTVTSTLKLEGDAAAKVSEILKAEVGKRQEAVQAIMNGGGDRSAMGAKMQEIAQETEKELSGVLSAEQLKEYKAIREAWQAQARRPGGGGRPGGR